MACPIPSIIKAGWDGTREHPQPYRDGLRLFTVTVALDRSAKQEDALARQDTHAPAQMP